MSRKFNGGTDVIAIGSGGLLNTVQPMTVALWMASTGGWGGAITPFVCKLSGWGGAIGSWLFAWSAGNTLWFSKDGGAGADLKKATSSIAALTSGSFNHLALTWNSAINTTAGVAMYFNGVEQPYINGSTGITVVSDSSWSLNIGNNHHSNLAFSGYLAHVHVFRRVLSVNEIRALMYHPGMYNSGSVSAIGTAGLIGYWPLGGLKSPEPDLSGNQFSGVVTGAVFNVNEPPVNEVFVVSAPQMGYAS